MQQTETNMQYFYFMQAKLIFFPNSFENLQGVRSTEKVIVPYNILIF